MDITSRQQATALCFSRFKQDISAYRLPERFTFPFYYTPHPLCVLAAKELQDYLTRQQDFQHNFGLGDDPHLIIGKMFGVLLVADQHGEIGYLAAFSGKLAEQNHVAHFVPPVFDMLSPDSYFLREQADIKQLTEQIEHLQQQPHLAAAQQAVKEASEQRDAQIATHRALMINNRAERKARRQHILATTAPEQADALLSQLDQQSIDDKLQLKYLSLHWEQQLAQLQQQLNALLAQIEQLKQQRKQRSAALQEWIFSQYQFLNQAGQRRDLASIFSQTALHTPPAGAGECAAPKLLHYAFARQLKPLAMAEFWWGASPKSEIRQHGQFYPACMGKCQPILAHMLDGMAVDDNPMLNNPAHQQQLEIIYQDEHMLIVNKPAELLSVPGKQISDSVQQRIKAQFPHASGPLIVHRLDMSTSGLMVLALTPQAHKALQKQFIQRQVRKTYVALLDGIVEQDSGEISLPLRGDLYDRPRQIVCEQHGKPALTHWQVIARYPQRQQTLVNLSPHTGRTHQLRVHCAHPQGLNRPIVGDDLYGKVANRLHLHAKRLELRHPVNHSALRFEIAEEF